MARMMEKVAGLSTLAAALVLSTTGVSTSSAPVTEPAVAAPETVLIRGCDGLDADHIATLQAVARQKGESFESLCENVVREALAL
ncbi:MAG: hypothetical protein AAGA24_05650 [Pseudomonadota bacterium]